MVEREKFASVPAGGRVDPIAVAEKTEEEVKVEEESRMRINLKNKKKKIIFLGIQRMVLNLMRVKL